MDFAEFVGEWAERLRKFMEKYCPSIWGQIVEAAKRSLESAFSILNSCKEKILRTCRENKVILSSMVLKLGTKSVIKQAAKEVVKVGFKGGTKLAASTATKAAVTGVTKVALKSISNPAGAVADLAQAGLELAGHKEVGKKVGFTGNAGGGAVAGFMVAGPVGAGLGAAAGTTVWFVGEVVGSVFD